MKNNKFKKYNLLDLNDDEYFIKNDNTNINQDNNLLQNQDLDTDTDTDIYTDTDSEAEFNISIVKNDEFENKVNLTLNIQIKCNNILDEMMTIELDINDTTYNKIINDLYK